jgi:hypothetical protein
MVPDDHNDIGRELALKLRELEEDSEDEGPDPRSFMQEFTVWIL